MDYVVTSFLEIKKEEAFRNYMADGVYAISNAVGKGFNAEHLVKRFSDIVSPREQQEEVEVTEEEVLEQLRAKWNKGKNNGSKSRDN